MGKMKPIFLLSTILVLLLLKWTASNGQPTHEDEESEERNLRKYFGFQVVTANITSKDQFEALRKCYLEGRYDFWTAPKPFGTVDIMASPEEMTHLNKLLEKMNVNFHTKIDNVESLIQAERASAVDNLRLLTVSKSELNWQSYADFLTIESWLNSLKSPIATVSVIGKTYENRNIYMVKLSTGGPSKKSVVIDANIHAREWVTSATALWLINEITASSTPKFLDHIDLYIIPLLNADGYEFSRTKNRLWRKNRSRHSSGNLLSLSNYCVGTDPNRNFGFMFGKEGTSSNPCSEIYPGPTAFSEPEAAAVRNFVVGKEAEGVKFNAYLTLHSYGQVWLLPWGYTKGKYPNDYSEQLDLGKASIAAVKEVHGTVYETGTGADLLYGVGGASDDWAKDHGIKYTVTIEMRDTGKYGFLLPADQIVPNAEEVWAGIQVLLNHVADNE